MPFPPDAYLIGAQKAGTTTLAYLLDQHPRVAVSEPKEPHFLTHNRDKGLDWYRERFPLDTDSVFLDASTSYSRAPLDGEGSRPERGEFAGVPEAVFSMNPWAKLIYSLRDPVERTYSGYWHSVRTGRQSGTFAGALENNTPHLDVGDYHAQILRWLEYFPLESFHFVLFEELIEDPGRVAGGCFEFLLGEGAEMPCVRLDSAKNRSYNNSPMGRRLNKLFIGHPGLLRLLTSPRRAFPKLLRDRVREFRFGSEPVPDMSSEEREFLVGYFREKNRNLERLTGLSLHGWQP